MSRVVRWSVLVGVFVAVFASAGIGVRSTYGAQVSGDEPQYLLTALSLWEDGDLDIADELAGERFRPFHELAVDPQTRVLEDGRQISPHDPLLPLLLALPMGVGGWVAAKATMAVMAGLLAGLLTWTAVTRLSVRLPVAAATILVLSLSPPLAVYATQVYPELPAALAVAVGLALVLPSRGVTVAGKWGVTAAIVALPWLGIKYVPIAAVLAVTLLLRLPASGRRGLLAVLGAAGVLYVIGHLWIYGGLTPYATGDHFVGGELTVVGTGVNLLGRSSRLLGLLVDQSFGLGPWQPAYLLLPLVAVWAGVRRTAAQQIPLLVLLGVGWLMATFVALTMHGWWFPGRQLVGVMPAALLLLASWVDQGGWRIPVLLLPGALGVVGFAHLVREGLSGSLTWIVDFGSTTNPIFTGIASAFPDYQAPTDGTWLLHGIWISIVALLAWGGWRDAAGPSRRPARIGPVRARERIPA